MKTFLSQSKEALQKAEAQKDGAEDRLSQAEESRCVYLRVWVVVQHVRVWSRRWIQWQHETEDRLIQAEG